MRNTLTAITLIIVNSPLFAQIIRDEKVSQEIIRDSILGLQFDQLLYFIFTIIFVIVIYFAAKFLLDRQKKGKADKGILRSIILFCLGLFGAITIILSIPMGDSLRNDIIGLIGIVLAAALSLSSATLLGNAMAGIQLSMIKLFKPGDFIEVSEIFGRVSEKGLFHTEVQTVDRNLITLPNLFLSNNPVKVTRSSGTIISSSCSLGYDVSRIQIEKCLLEAAKRAGLTDNFVHIMELGDFSVVYQIHGMLENVDTVISAKSKLHSMMLDCLHENEIEIVSPSFMNQRQVGETIYIPKKDKKSDIDEIKNLQKNQAEKLIFDKADEAKSIENRKEKIIEIDDKIKVLTQELKDALTSEDKLICTTKIEKWNDIKQKMIDAVDIKLEEIENKA